MISNDWIDYKVLATGGGEKLERWGNVILLRPDPQIIWESQEQLSKYKGLNAHYVRSKEGGGNWNIINNMPEEWTIKYKNLTFSLKPMGFKHTGLFPEQAVNWDQMMQLINSAKREIKVLNLFGYTGGATVACSKAGAKVTHVDAAKGMVDRAKINCNLSNCKDDSVRYIVDDCKKFILREIKRGNKYDALIMDPPSYGRGPNGELWKLEDNLFELVNLTKEVLSEKPLFYLINSYTTGLGASVLNNILNIVLKDYKGTSSGYEVLLPTEEKGVVLPCGNSALWRSGD